MYKFWKDKRGFMHVELFLLIFIVGTVGVVGYYVLNKHSKSVSAQSQSSTEVYRWGNYAASTSEGTPQPIIGLTSIVALEASNSSSYVLQCVGGVTACPTDGTVWSFGNNQNGQLGNGTTQSSMNIPVKVQFPAGVDVVSIGEAFDTGFAVDSTGQGWAWGANSGALCTPNGKTSAHLVPQKVPGITEGVQVQGGSGHVIWLLSNGTVEQCSSASTVVQPISNLSNVIQITAGNNTSGARDSSGNVWMWGNNSKGQVGVNSTAGSIPYPTEVKLPAPAIELYSGGDHPNNGHTLVLLSNHQVYAWGDDGNHQLGDGSKINKIAPVQVNVPAGVTFTYVAAGGQQSFAVDTTGRVWHWGNDSARFKVVDGGANLVSATAGDVLDHH